MQYVITQLIEESIKIRVSCYYEYRVLTLLYDVRAYGGIELCGHKTLRRVGASRITHM